MFKILIAEDDNELCQLFKKVLNKHGYQVLCVADGKEALDLVEKEYIDLIITDMAHAQDGYKEKTGTIIK